MQRNSNTKAADNLTWHFGFRPSYEDQVRAGNHFNL